MYNKLYTFDNYYDNHDRYTYTLNARCLKTVGNRQYYIDSDCLYIVKLQHIINILIIFLYTSLHFSCATLTYIFQKSEFE